MKKKKKETFLEACTLQKTIHQTDSRTTRYFDISTTFVQPTVNTATARLSDVQYNQKTCPGRHDLFYFHDFIAESTTAGMAMSIRAGSGICPSPFLEEELYSNSTGCKSKPFALWDLHTTNIDFY